MEFVFDIETTGLPNFKTKKRTEKYPSPADIDAYDSARIVSIAWLLIKKDTKEIVQQEYYVVKCDNFTIPESSTKIHGITTEFASENGIEIKEVFERLGDCLEKTNKIVSYNIGFDYNVLKSELIRYNENEKVELLDSKFQLCVMLLSQDHMAAPFYPKLSDSYSFVFHKPISDAHNAMGDTLSCYKLYKALAR